MKVYVHRIRTLLGIPKIMHFLKGRKVRIIFALTNTFSRPSVCISVRASVDSVARSAYAGFFDLIVLIHLFGSGGGGAFS